MNLSDNLRAFLTMIAVSEGTEKYPEHGYKTIVGGGQFESYADHPRKVITLKGGLRSSAAGRYQVLARIFDHYKDSLDLPDFSPSSQDRIALQLIMECHAMDDVLEGRIEDAIHKCRSRWASFPDAGYKQGERTVDYLITAYNKALSESEAA